MLAESTTVSYLVARRYWRYDRFVPYVADTYRSPVDPSDEHEKRCKSEEKKITRIHYVNIIRLITRPGIMSI